MATPRKLIIDCDPGVDDAVMLMMALAAPQLDVMAITTVAGNVPLTLTSRNARMMCELMNRSDVPVFAGCPRPLLRVPVTAEDFHGESGIAGVEVFEPATPLADGHAVTALIDLLRSAQPGEITLVITGPMTNIATAFVMAPDIATSIGELIIMGGAQTAGGNITPSAEFNIFADPHAAAIVFNSGVPATVLSLDVTQTVRAEPDRIAGIAAIPGARAALMTDLLNAANELEGRWKNNTKAPMHDPSTIAYLLGPHLFETYPASVRVMTEEGDHFGQTLVVEKAEGPHRWASAADADGFFDLIENLLRTTS